MRPQSWWAFAAGLTIGSLTIGSLTIAAAATFGSSQAQEIPACDSPVYVSWSQP